MAIRRTIFPTQPPLSLHMETTTADGIANQPRLVDGWHFSEIIVVRTYHGANIDSDHYLVMVKLRPKHSFINNVRYRRLSRYNIERLKQLDVTSAYAQNVEASLPDEGELDEDPLEDCWRPVKADINDAAESTIR